MKRKLLLLVPAASLAVLAGCASEDSDYSVPAHAATVIEAPTVAVTGLDPSQVATLQADSAQTLYRIQQGIPLDIPDIKALSRAGVSDQVIIDRIRDTRSRFYLTTQQIVDLSQTPVSTRVIDYMRSTAGAAGAYPGTIGPLSVAQRERLQADAPATLERFDRAEPLTVANIEALSRAGVDRDVIIGQIRNAHCVYHLSAQDIVDLNQSGVNSSVIDCMRNTSAVGSSYAGRDIIEPSVRDRVRSQSPETWERFEHDRALSVTDIKVLSQAGVSSDALIDHIRDAHAVYYLSTQDIVDLNSAGVNVRVVDFMLNTPRYFAFTPVPATERP